MERHRREQELKRKRDALSLEEIKDHLTKYEERLKQLKDEKHETFSALKKLINEDEMRKRRESEQIAQQQAAAQAQVQAAAAQAAQQQQQASIGGNCNGIVTRICC